MAQIVNQTREEYFADETRCNASTAKIIINSGGYGMGFHPEYSGTELGNAIHKFCETLNSKTIISLPDATGTKTYKTVKSQEFIAQHSGLQVLTPSDYDSYSRLLEAFNSRNDPDTKYIRDIVTNPKALKEVVIHFELSGVPCKAMIDLLILDDEKKTAYKVDHKSSSTKTPSEFDYSYNNKGYWFSDAWYTEAVTQLGYSVEKSELFVFQTVEPYNIYPMTVDLAEFEEIFPFMNVIALDWQQIKRSGEFYGYRRSHGHTNKLTLNGVTKKIIKSRMNNIFGEI